MGTKTYNASCHCGSVRFKLTSEDITTGRRCNCSICIRKGAVMSSNYFRPLDVEVEGSEHLARYQFGDKDLNHLFCRTCGVSPLPGPAARLREERQPVGASAARTLPSAGGSC